MVTAAHAYDGFAVAAVGHRKWWRRGISILDTIAAAAALAVSLGPSIFMTSPAKSLAHGSC
jgi:hypothetical protein